MKIYPCQCGNTLHFENSSCVVCHREVGWCPSCEGIRSLDAVDAYTYSCNHCQAQVTKCLNYRNYQVCNRLVEVKTTWQEANAYCKCCSLNRVVPDMSVPGNREKWYNLEAAKRRLIYTLDLLKLPYGSIYDGFPLPLTFDFKGNVVQITHAGTDAIIAEKVFTGHADGTITINIEEADPIEREKLRVDFGEARRTLIGHFHHEIGHYYWQLLVQNKCEDECKAIFGDHTSLGYSYAMNQYYQYGPKPDWPLSYISAYASMHPWEDFAETFRAYLEMITILDTADSVHLLLEAEEAVDFEGAPFEKMLLKYEELGIKLNEMNRTLGLLDMVPEVFTPAVIQKMKFIHKLVKQGRLMNNSMQKQAVFA
ncbi:zinc-binding metallopeptidase family protein [Spirosoma foliorum]|uniref:Putative zinc-binding metallopeptidase n=1 Tax=Spirosoma foliorum TaxID=2710596 RepID=A0A7G5GRD9_9BACT|nr:putative zinc-binding metallopeptidase [Spirosoma foliorum]QMW01431.1 putative zinc-binding metallopeptidase [Spirosoma foliorum]